MAEKKSFERKGRSLRVDRSRIEKESKNSERGRDRENLARSGNDAVECYWRVLNLLSHTLTRIIFH